MITAVARMRSWWWPLALPSWFPRSVEEQELREPPPKARLPRIRLASLMVALGGPR